MNHLNKINRSSFSRPRLLIFALIFSLVGLFIYISFAAPNQNLPGDLNNDNTVSVTDLSILLSNYATTNSVADINSDGHVDIVDLSILLSHYGQSFTPPSPTVTLAASPSTVTAGQISTLSWSSTNATSCTASGGWSGSKSISGNASTSAINTTTMYVLTCSGLGGSKSASTTVTVSGGGNPLPTGISGNWTMKFDDEFTSTTLNKSVWTTGWFSNGISGPANSSEIACYDPANLSLPGDGYLHMKLIAKSTNCSGQGGGTRPYDGSLISSNPHDGVSGHTGFDYAFGAIEYRIYLPAAASNKVANWPGTWSDGQNWPTDGENDVMEGLGGDACFHFHSPVGGPGGCAAGSYAGWHTFGANWQSGAVTYYYDGVQVGRITSGITSSLQYLIIQSTTGVNSLTSVPADQLLDYVRVWQ